MTSAEARAITNPRSGTFFIAVNISARHRSFTGTTIATAGARDSLLPI